MEKRDIQDSCLQVTVIGTPAKTASTISGDGTRRSCDFFGMKYRIEGDEKFAWRPRKFEGNDIDNKENEGNKIRLLYVISIIIG